MQTLKLLGVAMLAVTVLDFIWLGLLMPRFYDQQLGEIARRSGASLAPRWSAAIIVYVLIPLGVVLFVRPLFTPSTTLWQALAWGALYGLILYGTYDFTNLATLEKWNWKLALIDTAWGAAICGLTSVAVKAALDWMTKSPGV